MRCIACGMEMRFVRAVPDQSMVSAHELQMFECPGCPRTEQRLVFTHTIEPLPSEPMQLPSVASPVLTAAAHKVSVAVRSAWMHAVATLDGGLSAASALLTPAGRKVSVAARGVWARAAATVGGSLPSASSALLTSARHKVMVAARSAWARAVAMVRGRQEGV